MSSPQEPPLPAAVEELLETIALEKKKPAADTLARKYLAEISEEDSIDVLKAIRKSMSVRNLSGFIVHMVKKKRSGSISPKPSPCTARVSPYRRGFNSPASDTGTPSSGDASTPNKRRRTLNFSDDIVTSITEFFDGSPTTYEAMADTGKECVISPSVTMEARPDMLIPDSIEDALAELEFEKAFLLLNYSGREKLETLVTAERIRSLSRHDMSRFETYIWNDFGRDICKANERRRYFDWGSGSYLTYHCHVYGDGSYSFKGPFFNKTTTILHKTIGDENVLIVKFLEAQEESSESGSWHGPVSVMSSPAFNKVFEEGILIGRKKYQFFVFKDGGKEEKRKDPTSCPVKCYFVNLKAQAFCSFFDKDPQFFKKRTIQEARSIFMHINKASTVANYMSRFSLILSKTVTLDGNMDGVIVEDIKDIPCLDEEGKPVPVKNEVNKFHIHTDGTGFISEDLALKCPLNFIKGYVPYESNIKKILGAVPHARELSELNQLKSNNLEPPLLIQFRMFHQGRAIKGTVLVNRKLPPKTIQVRPSMVKIQADDKLAPGLSTFEIVCTSNKPKRPRLSKNLIALLHYGGVPEQYFFERLDDALKDVQSILYKKRGALKVAISRDADDDCTVAKMILSGLPLDEPFLQHRLSVLAREERKSLRAGKIPINNSFYLMGTADPTETLNSGEVCVILEHGQISGPVLVYRNPGLHIGDVHVVNARYVKELEEIVGNSKYGIFFPSKGPRSMADEIAGGDYDGDMYWVSRDPKLLANFKPSAPWTSSSSPLTSSSKKVDGLSVDVLERELFRLYLKTRFQSSPAMGVAADCWTVYMDRILTLKDESFREKEGVMQKIEKLIDAYYDALDAPKKGIKIEVSPDVIPDKYPHHMEKGGGCTYRSKSILGEIYDKVDACNDGDPVTVWKLPYFEEQINQIPTGWRQVWRQLYVEYKGDMTAALQAGHESRSESAAAVYRLYKRKLYGVGPEDEADDLDKSRKSWEEIRANALAIYDAAYECAAQENDPGKCNFAWKVAGSALIKIFMEEQGEKPICCAPSVLREVFL